MNGGAVTTRPARCPQGQRVYRVYRAGVSGWKLVCAKDEEGAKKRIRSKTQPATKAELVLPSSHWQEQRALGNYPVRGSRRTRRGK